MASKKERQKKKRIAQNERKLSDNKNEIINSETVEEQEDAKGWIQPPRQEEIEFEHDGQNYRTFYRIFIMHKNHKGEVHQYKLEKAQFSVLTGTILLLLVTVCAILVFREYSKNNQLDNALSMIATLQGQLNAERQRSNDLSLQISELTEKADILSETLTARTEALSVYQEEERKQHLPTSYPLRGNASYYVQEETEEGEGEAEEPEQDVPVEPGIRFMTGTGSSMVATADGEITGVSMAEDGSYTVVIDHGNGYMTFYTGPGTIMVKEGDSVTTGTILLGITAENTVLTYQIILNGEYIDPMECMEING